MSLTRKCLAALCLGMLLATRLTAIALSGASLHQLENGLTLVMLEDNTFPVVSVQMLYRVGARSEENGRTGLAHFLEHMAFRASENFPDTDVASAIYAVGGEWHGYTWLDETTYFETVPRQHLDLVLRVEADRMARLVIPADQVEPERGAVLAEMHGYENDPRTVLKDAVIATSFQQHPYRNNTIGWESDVEKVTHSDLTDFYRHHYHAANAVLAVVGDFAAEEVLGRVEELFGASPRREVTEAPRTVEPPQMGERRLEIHGAGSRSFFEIVYRAPAVVDPAWAVFLVLQEILGGSDGVNFAQNEWGVAAREESRLYGLTEDLVTWYPPMAQPYVLSIAGSVREGADRKRLEDELEERLERLRREPVSELELQRAKQRVLAELVFDLETTEDAAHQLAYFAGVGGLEALLGLREEIQAVGAMDLLHAARHFLAAHRRTVGWYLAGDAPAITLPRSGDPRPASAIEISSVGRRREEPFGIGSPEVRLLESGLPVIFQRNPFSPSAYLRVLVPSTSTAFPIRATADRPIWRHTSLDLRFLPGELVEALDETYRALHEGEESEAASAPASDDPAQRLRSLFDELLGIESGASTTTPRAIVLVGDLEPEEAFAAVRERWSGIRPAAPLMPLELELRRQQATIDTRSSKAQAQLGYVVPAPPPAHPDHLAWRALLYILTHGYEGRLGKEAISRRGLLYYISSRFHSDGSAAWIALEMGVDPPKLEAMRTLLIEMLADLERRPPTAQEVDEAKRHLVGRRQSAYQSNEEVSAALLEEWVGLGRLRSLEEYAADVERLSREELLRVLPAFVGGAVVAVEVGNEMLNVPPPVGRAETGTRNRGE